MSAAAGFAHPEFLIDTAVLEGQLGEPNLCIFDCTTNLLPDTKTTYQAVPARADFEKGNMPGAQFIDLQAHLSAKRQRRRYTLQEAACCYGALSRFGVGERVCVVVYSPANPWWATRVWWLLRVF